MKNFTLSLFLWSTACSTAWGAACCGGGSNSAGLILSDDKAQVILRSSAATTIGDVSQQGRAVFRRDSDNENVFTQALEGGTLLSDRWQIGGVLNVIQRSRSTGISSAADWGLGDLSVSLGYEVLPEFSYSEWKPRGYTYLQWTIPSGGNIYESTEPFAVDARGKGFHSLALGLVFVKSFGAWDSQLRAIGGLSFSRRFDLADGTQIAGKPGPMWSTMLGVGRFFWNGNWRLGLAIQPTYTQDSELRPSKLVWDSSVSASYLANSSFSVQATYTDQTLLGPARNTTLDRVFAVALQHRWSR